MRSIHSRPLRVLIIDDVPADRARFRRHLNHGEERPCEVVEVESGEAARAHLRESLPDCLLLNVDLPDGDGLSLVRQIVATHGENAFGIVLLTSAANVELAVQALQCGAHDFLHKSSLNFLALKRAVTNAVEKAAIQRELDEQRRVLAVKNAELQDHVARLEREAAERQRTETQLKAARDEAVAASRAKDEFLAALSHELRTPLNPVLLLASEAAENDALPEEIRAVFETIRKNVDLEARLIDDLLNLTRISRGKMVLDRHLVDVHAILSDAIANIATDVAQKHLSLRLHAEAPWHTVLGDAVRLQQVFWNVLKNAVKFTAEGGSITVQTHSLPEQDELQVLISDTGIGLTTEELERVFDAFAQGAHAETGGAHKFGGLGLGLAISRMLVQSHGGRISASSAGRGHGSTFAVRLPLAPQLPDILPQHGNGHSQGEITAPPPDPAATHILLVEDHEPTRTALEQLLRRRRYQVTAAGGVAEALAEAAQARFDLVISDIGLPDGSGYDLMQTLTARHGSIRGIALTGYGMERDVARSREAGFHNHLTKPIRMQSLDDAICLALTRDR